jgi:hypothetical protein
VYIKGSINPLEQKMFLQKQLELLRTSREVARFQKKEESFVKRQFYTDFSFKKADLALKKEYFWQNPYRLSRRFWNRHVYGETPLTSLETIGLKARLSEADRFVDLGAGRGRGVFFMHYRFGCRALGIERVPTFIEKALKIQKKLKAEGVEFLQADLRDCPQTLNPSSSNPSIHGTVFYLAWTCFEDALVLGMTRWLEQLPNKTRIITVSEPLDKGSFSVIDQFSVPFAWGEGDIYVHEKKEPFRVC